MSVGFEHHVSDRHGSRRSVPLLEGGCGRGPGAVDNFPQSAASRRRVGPKRLCAPSATAGLHAAGSLAAVLLRTTVALVAGLSLGLSFEPAGQVLLLVPSIAALFWCARGRSLRGGALLGLVFGVGYFHVLLFWLRVIGVDAWMAVSWFQALYLCVLGAGLALVARSRLWPAWMPVLWVAVEAFRGAWPMGGVSWGRIGFGVADTPFADWLPWVGSTGVSLLLALAAGLLAWLVALADDGRPTARDVVRRSAVVVVAAGLLLVPPSSGWSGTDRGAYTMAVVQGDVPGDGDDLVAHHREVTRSHVDLTRDLAEDVARGEARQPDLVVWPENATAMDPFTTSIAEPIREAVREVGVPMLLGGIVDAARGDQVLNQGIVVDPETGPGDRYTKRHPVPYGEYIPYRRYFGTWTSERLDLVPRDMLAGTGKEPLRVDDVEVADLICFDVAYDDALVDQVTRGAELVTIQTSNALFIHTGQIEQQYEISRLRALETGRYVVVAAVNGRSGVIGPDGKLVSGIEPRTRAVLVEDVRLVGGVPPSMVLGPWVGRLCVLLGLGAVAAGVLPYRRRWSMS
jgi:apolipoprotein N-acyltransferase